MIIATLLGALACGLLVFAEWRRDSLLRNVSKPIASLAFIVVGAIAHDLGVVWECVILAGLVLGAVGDVALLGKSDRSFMLGLVAFLLGHIAYVVAFALLVPMTSWIAWASMVPVMFGASALRYLWPRLGSMKIPVIVYVIAIVLMFAGAIAVHRSDALPLRRAQLVLVGAALFFASDLAVAQDKFVKPGFPNRAWGLPCYYAGQFLIAWSLADA